MKIANTPEEPEFMNSLLNRQDEVIAGLDQLEATILKVIDEIGDQRAAEAVGRDQVDLLDSDAGAVEPTSVSSKAA